MIYDIISNIMYLGIGEKSFKGEYIPRMVEKSIFEFLCFLDVCGLRNVW